MESPFSSQWFERALPLPGDKVSKEHGTGIKSAAQLSNWWQHCIPTLPIESMQGFIASVLS
jgi:hypothetical protein